MTSFLLSVMVVLAATSVHAFAPLPNTASVVVSTPRTPIAVPRAAADESTSLTSTTTTNNDSSPHTDKTTITTTTTTTLLSFLDDALCFNSTAAATLVSTLNDMRRGGDSDGADRILNDILDAVDGPIGTDQSPLPFWSRKLRFLTRFSRRSRRASLQRLLDLSTPAADDEEEDKDDQALRRRRRRSLFVVLCTLADPDSTNTSSSSSSSQRAKTAVIQLERIARQEAKASTMADDLASRLPPGLETPNYEVLARREAGYEIRRYEPFAMCSVSMAVPRTAENADKTDAKLSNPQLPGARAFGALAGYLFGKNDASTAMKMTTPVFSTDTRNDNSNDVDGVVMDKGRSMSFVLPSDYWKEDGILKAPQPLEGSGVTLLRDEGGDRAAMLFGGIAGKRESENRKEELLQALATDEEWEAAPEATVTLAQYNDPFTPPWKRRNEVAIKIVPKVAASNE